MFLCGSVVTNARPHDTLHLALHSGRPYTYHGMDAVGARVRCESGMQLHGIDIPVIADSGRQVRLRLLSNERDAVVPVAETDIAPPLMLRTAKSGNQLLSVRFSAPVLVQGAQFFIMLDEIDPRVAVISTKSNTSGAYCQCAHGTFTQQTLKQRGQWATAEQVFPWTLYYEPLQRDQPILLSADTVAQSALKASSSEPFALMSADINQDGILDIVARNAVLIGKGNRRFHVDTSLSKLISDMGIVPTMDPALGLIVVDERDSVHLDTVLVVESTLRTPVRVRKLHTGVRDGHALATWLLTSSSSPIGSDNEREAVAAMVVQSRSRSEAARVQLWRIRERSVALMDQVLLPHVGKVVGVATSSIAGDSSLVEIISVGEWGLKAWYVDIAHGRAELRDSVLLSSWLLDVPGPGYDVLDDRSVLRRGFPVTPTSLDNHSATRGQEAMSSTRAAGAAWWDSERRSSTLKVDLNNDGVQELIFPTSDTCYPPHAIEERGSGDLTSEAILIDIPDLVALAGSSDLLAEDLDDDGRVDIVGYRGATVVILWNNSNRPLNDQPALSSRSTHLQASVRGLFVSRYACMSCGFELRDRLALARRKSASATMQAEPSVFSQSCAVSIESAMPGAQYVLTVMDQSGRVVKTYEGLTNNTGAAFVQWDGSGADSVTLSSGLYVFSLAVAGEQVTTPVIKLH